MRLIVLLLTAQLMPASDSSVLAAQLSEKGASLFSAGRYEEAAGCFKQALHLWKVASKTTDIDIAPAHANLAQVYLAQGRLREAKAEAGLARQFSNSSNSHKLGILLAGVYFRTGHPSEAEAILLQLLPTLKAADLAKAQNDLGMIRASAGNLTEARRLLEASVDGYPKADAKRAIVLANLGLVCLRARDLSSALRHYREAIAIFEASSTSDQSHLAIALAEYSQVLRKLGHKSEYKVASLRAKKILAASTFVNSVDVLSLR